MLIYCHQIVTKELYAWCFFDMLFTTDFFTKSNFTIILHPLYSLDLAPCNFSLFLWPKFSFKSCWFKIVKIIQAETYTVLGILPKHNFHNTLKKMAESLWPVWMCGRGLLQEDDGNQQATLSRCYWQHGNTSPEILVTTSHEQSHINTH